MFQVFKSNSLEERPPLDSLVKQMSELKEKHIILVEKEKQKQEEETPTLETKPDDKVIQKPEESTPPNLTEVNDPPQTKKDSKFCTIL